MTTVWALGHSNRSLAEFLAMLKAHAIALLVDVRRHPGSRTVPWTQSESLARELAAAGVGYLHMPELGGRRRPVPGSRNLGLRNEQFRGYADHMATAEFQASLRQLVDLARDRRVAVMCAEAVPWRCHRSLLADALVARGVEVVQVISAEKAMPHRLHPAARVRRGRVTYPGERPLDA